MDGDEGRHPRYLIYIRNPCLNQSYVLGVPPLEDMSPFMRVLPQRNDPLPSPLDLRVVDTQAAVPPATDTHAVTTRTAPPPPKDFGGFAAGFLFGAKKTPSGVSSGPPPAQLRAAAPSAPKAAAEEDMPFLKARSGPVAPQVGMYRYQGKGLASSTSHAMDGVH